MKLIYWDIDGTMINTGMAGTHAIYDVFRRLMGDDAAVPHISAGGRTDNYICQQLLYQARGGSRQPSKTAVFLKTCGKIWNTSVKKTMWHSSSSRATAATARK